jgi:hypothetical protein
MVRIHPDPPQSCRVGSPSGNPWGICMTGGLAQLGEHLLCKQGVVGSIPSSSTNPQCVGFCPWAERCALAIEPVSVIRSQGLRYRLSFFNNQEEVVKRFTKGHLEMGGRVGESGL